MYEKNNIEIASRLGNYTVHFDKLIFNKVADLQNSIILIDQNLFQIMGLTPTTNTLPIQPGEGAKQLSNVSQVISRLVDMGLNKDSILIGIGGGSIQDLVAFTASIYMRGINWIFYPSTLQAMVDSCIGGKSAINVGPHKNLVGNFFPPKEIVIDCLMASSLSQEDIVCGLMEALKIAFASGEEDLRIMLQLVSKVSEKFRQNEQIIEDITHKSLVLKKYFVEQDEFDLGRRKLLNFGHTYGHAIEASTNFRIHHGLAVGIGMLASFVHRFENTKTQLEQDFINTICSNLKPFAEKIRSEMALIKFPDFAESIQMDKKRSQGSLRFIHSKFGYLEIVTLPNDTPTHQEAFNSVLEAAHAI